MIQKNRENSTDGINFKNSVTLLYGKQTQKND